MTTGISLRTWKLEDASALSAICNNKKIWLNVRDRFPFPYTVKDALQWIFHTISQKPVQNFAIEYDGKLAGSIGITLKDDIYRKTMEIGYFIAENYWGMGIATQAVAEILRYIRKEFDIVRIYAEVFETNKASMKVLENNGFHLEGIRKKAVMKDNVIMDDFVWVIIS